MPWLREKLTLVLIVVLPFHALFVTVGTKLLLGLGHPPMPMLAVWKEALLAMILLIAALEFLRKPSFNIDRIDGLIVALFAIALALPKTNFLFGFKYDFIPLIAFLMLRRVSWSDQFKTRAEGALLFVGGIVAAYGILTFFLPTSFFTALGYSEAHSLYLPNGPLAAFQQISETGIRRIQSTMSGPNQLGIWLLIPLSVCAVRIANEKLQVNPSASSGEKYRAATFHYSLFTILCIALALTFSRSAWIAAFVIGCVIAWKALPKKIFASGVGVIFILAIIASLLLPSVFIRRISLTGHMDRPLQAIRMIMEHPLGLGLGAAGPAANRTHGPCVFLEEGSDFSWAQGSPDLCVFVGKTQVQPAGQQCDCPLVPENWYLQVGVELGVLGFILYMILTGLVLKKLMGVGAQHVAPLQGFLIFLGVSIAALFLHAWEDTAVVYTAWVLLAMYLTPIEQRVFSRIPGR